jgi:hypothetical protein
VRGLKTPCIGLHEPHSKPNNKTCVHSCKSTYGRHESTGITQRAIEILIEGLVDLQPLYEEEIRMHKMYSIVVQVQFKFGLQHSKKHVKGPSTWWLEGTDDIPQVGGSTSGLRLKKSHSSISLKVHGKARP